MPESPAFQRENEAAAPAKSAETSADFIRDASTIHGVRQPPLVSIVVPTRNEAENIGVLVHRLGGVMRSIPYEVIFVDDSTDDTPAVIETIQADGHPEVRLHHRPPGRRLGGLGGAVVEGLRLAHSSWVCVMDADLQHPPEVVPELLAIGKGRDVDLVIASRYCAQGDVGGFNQVRAAVSQASTAAARVIFPRRLRGVSDPMSGFFLVRRAAVDPCRLRPCGFKILLEIIGRTPGLRIAEVPFHFGTRHAGESKASLREGVRYLRLLLGLRFGDTAVRFARFGAVGLSGLVVNVIALTAFTEFLGLFYLVSAVLATQCSTLWNFALTESWVFRDHSDARRLRRAAMFFAMNNAALGLRGPMLFVLTTSLGIHYVVSNVVTLMVLLLLRYASSDRLIWGRLQHAAVQPALGDR